MAADCLQWTQPDSTRHYLSHMLRTVWYLKGSEAMLHKSIVPLLLVLLFAACAPSVQRADPFLDSRLNCEELAEEITRTRALRDEAESNKGMSGQNIGWALVFWPAIFANEASNKDAIEVAEERLRYLYAYYGDRECTTLGSLSPRL